MFREFMGGASGRLLPISVPFRFFGTAMGMHILAWAGIAYAGGEIPGFLGGPGVVLAALHAVTLGVAAMTAMGAAFQLLPVATKRPLRSVAACKATFWLFLTGVAVLLWGMAADLDPAMNAGSGLAVAGLLIWAFLVADNLRRVADMRVVTDHAWIALTSLVVLGLLGLLLVADFSQGFLPNHQAVAAAHAVVAGYGFMGVLAFGFSFILMPMFALSPQPNARLGRFSARLAGAALILAVTGLVSGIEAVVWLGGAAGVAAVALHLRAMTIVMKTRMKKGLGGSFLLIRLAWVMLPASVLTGLTATAGVAVDKTAPLFGFLLVFGWLLSLITGVLQRIMPFLGSMFSTRPGLKPVLVSKLTAGQPLRVHLICHFAGLALVSAGILSGDGLVVRLGGAVGLVGAVAFALFAGLLWYRLTRHIHPTPQPSET